MKKMVADIPRNVEKQAVGLAIAEALALGIRLASSAARSEVVLGPARVEVVRRSSPGVSNNPAARSRRSACRQPPIHEALLNAERTVRRSLASKLSAGLRWGAEHGLVHALRTLQDELTFGVEVGGVEVGGYRVVYTVVLIVVVVPAVTVAVFVVGTPPPCFKRLLQNNRASEVCPTKASRPHEDTKDVISIWLFDHPMRGALVGGAHRNPPDQASYRQVCFQGGSSAFALRQGSERSRRQQLLR